MKDFIQPLGRILRMKQVCAQTGISRSSIYQQISDGAFPKPIRLGKRGVGWIESEVDAWIQDRVHQSRDPNALNSNKGDLA